MSPHENRSLTAPEREMLAQAVLRPSDTSLNAPLLFDVSGCGAERLCRAVTRVMAGHPSLHSVIVNDADGDAVAAVVPVGRGCRVERVDALDDDAAVSLIRALADVPFNLAGDEPLVRARVWTCGERAYLGLVLSHVIVDFTAMARILRDIGDAYEDPGMTPGPGTAPTRADRVAGAEDYYRRLVRDRSEGLDNGLVPGRRPDAPLPGRVAVWRPGRRWSQALDTLAFTHRVAPVTVVLACVAEAVRALGIAGEPVVSMSFSNRAPGDASVRNTVNVLPLEVPLNGGSVGELFRRTHALVRRATRFESFCLRDALPVLAPDGYRGSTSADVAVTFYQEPMVFRTGPLVHRRVVVERSQVKFPLGISVSKDADGYCFELDIADALSESDPEAILRTVFEHALRSRREEPEARLRDLPRDELSHRLPSAVPVERTIPEIVREAARRFGPSTALSDERRRVTYDGLIDEVDRVAAAAEAEGLGRYAVLVGAPSVDYVVTFLSIIMSGRIAVPLAEDVPARRLDRILAVLGDDVSALRLPGALTITPGMTELSMPGDRRRGTGEEAARPGPPALDDTAYIIFTSGTTGEPKGVMATHRSVGRLFPDELPREAASPGVWPQFHSNAFDLSVLEILGSLSTGSELVVVPRDVRRDPARFASLMIEHSVTCMVQTPTALRNLLAVQDGERALSRLTAAMVGGEPMRSDIVENWDRLAPKEASLFNIYGPAETAIWISHERTAGIYQVPKAPPFSVGRAMEDVCVRVCDETGRTVPWGRPGELQIGGVCVSPGYVGMPELTRSRFVTDDDGRRFYRSGDIVTMSRDGRIYIRGRGDGQVQVRGHRVETAEIDAVLGTGNLVRASVTVPREEGAEVALYTFAVLVPGQSEQSVWDVIRRTLPGYMWPRRVIIVERLPHTPNHKIDSAALLEMLPAPAADDGVPVGEEPPADAGVRERVSWAWDTVVGGASDSPDLSFFDLGGTSAQVPVLANRLAGLFPDAVITTTTVFEAPSIDQMAARLEAGTAGPSPRRRGGRPDRSRLSRRRNQSRGDIDE
ncbi:AMP-binding protein [Actinomyces gerencseriae]|uniref:AMP-binding protein n=1 Tax=Actinomyces gerencseriae TaxID=52769 RepID=UPI000428CED1|nr:AMP-binding protein [Actinomyces gerencseriae]